MPNLRITVNADLGWMPGDLHALATAMEQKLHTQLEVPATMTNVLVATAITAPHTADIYAEFMFRKTPARDETALANLVEALQAALPVSFAGSVAFRAFGQTADTIFARDLDLTKRQVA